MNVFNVIFFILMVTENISSMIYDVWSLLHLKLFFSYPRKRILGVYWFHPVPPPLEKKTHRTDGRTDWLTDGSLVAWGIITLDWDTISSTIKLTQSLSLIKCVYYFFLTIMLNIKYSLIHILYKMCAFNPFHPFHLQNLW